jgi:uncharacterized membrane protein YtjA (UPF0391 family)
VLADIQLADGSSGIDAVKDILARLDVPVIFITAFPERLLTGERPEPTFLITKPFQPETVKAAIGQALFFHPRRSGFFTLAGLAASIAKVLFLVFLVLLVVNFTLRAIRGQSVL